MRTSLRPSLFAGAALVALAAPAAAQTAAGLMAAAGVPGGIAATLPPPVGGAPVGPSLVRDAGTAAARAMSAQVRAASVVGLAAQAQAATRASAASLNIARGLTGLGAQLPAGQLAGLTPAAGLVPAAQDTLGTRTWQGALAPAQAGDRVDVQQTDPRAVLSWQSFNVARETTVNFIQGTGAVDAASGRPAVPQPDWVAVNRVVGGLDPATGRRTPGLSPTRIAGRIVGDGTVVVIDQNGILFTGSAQVATRGLIATSLELGRQSATGSIPFTVGDRNREFLRLGLLGAADQATGSTGSSAFTFSAQGVEGPATVISEPLVEGDVTITAGANLAVGDLAAERDDEGRPTGNYVTGDAGLLLLAAPRVVNAGLLSADAGQVSLIAGRQFQLTRSTGAGIGDADVRGLLVTNNNRDAPGGGYVRNTGLIRSRRGYLALTGSDTGAILQEGVLAASTSVSRNGFVDLSAADVRLAPGSAIVIEPEASAETIPQSPDSIAAFRTSRLRVAATGGGVEVGANAFLYAPSADVALTGTRVFVDSGATIDVGGLKGVDVPGERNALQIGPLKRNDLRDTPNYREPLSPEEIAAGSDRFTLNGVTVFVDPRRSGVRADGTRWVGSPLIEAESYAQQVGITAAELMTTGGSVVLRANEYNEFGAGGTRNDPTGAGDVIVKAGATIDISGGWIRFAQAEVATSQLITRGGQIVDIGDADPNGDYVGLVNAFETSVTRFGVTQAFDTTLLTGSTRVGAYDEGRDAGALTITAPAVALDAALFADAFAGPLQRADGTTGSATASGRSLQGAPGELPAGGSLTLDATGDLRVTRAGAFAAVPATLRFGESLGLDATGALVRPERDPLSLLDPARRDTVLVTDSALTGAGLSRLVLGATGRIDVVAGTDLRLAPGGSLVATAGRGINVAGAIRAPGGVIDLATAQRDTAVVAGSAFRDDPVAVGSYDVVVDGTLDARGRFVNDLALDPSLAEGPGFLDGGTVAIAVAPRVVLSGDVAGEFVDASGSILINPGALVDVSAGALVRADGSIDVSGRGGDVALVNETNFFQVINNYFTAQQGSIRGLRITLPTSVPVPLQPTNPSQVNARVLVAPGSVRGHGFAGGGAFTLTTPAFAFGDTPAATGTTLPIGFVRDAGFATVDITVNKTALFPNRFDNALGGFNALLATEVVRVGPDQTLSLTRSGFAPLLDAGSVLALRGLASGSDLYGAITPSVPAAAFDQTPVALTFAGLTELDVAAGGRVDGAAGASLTIAKLRNAGTIRLAGGTITQRELLPGIYADLAGPTGALAVRDLAEVFTTLSDGTIPEAAPNALGLRGNNGAGAILTNAEVAFQRAIYLRGELDATEGVRLEPGSVTDLSGASLVNPRATTPNGAPIRDGRLVDGGVLTTTPALVDAERPFSLARTPNSVLEELNRPAPIAGRTLVAQPGATIDLSGVADSFDRLAPGGLFTPTAQWSEGGTLGLRAGGVIAGATIRAAGGAPQAEGGVLVARTPTLTQSDGPTPTVNLLSADAIMASGFDTFVAEGALATDGDVSLALGRAFIARSIPFDGRSRAATDYQLRLSATGDLVVDAPIIRFASIAQLATSAPVAGDGTAIFRARALDVEGAVVFDGLGQTRLEAAGDLRLVGAQPTIVTLGGAVAQSSLQGQLLTAGDLTLAAAQIYPTTGSTFTVAASGDDSTVALARTTVAAPPAPFSAGATLTIQAATVEQGGVLRVPLGTLRLGGNTPLAEGGLVLAPATETLTLAAGSITAVSTGGLSIPYGTTTDQVEYFFAPTASGELDAAPAAILRLAGETVTLAAGSTVDLTGGGDIYAYEFIPGTGGSRDVLDRLNQDPFSSNAGLQFPDGRQVYAIVPGLADAGLAAIDPIYAADYAALTREEQAGRRVFLEGGDGLAAGWYTLLPARYALLPGGRRVVEQPEYGPAASGQPRSLADGTLLTAGYYGTAGTDLRESELRVFSVQDQDTIRAFSRIALTSGTTTFRARAERDGRTPPRAPVDAGRLVLEPLTSLTAQGAILTAPAPGGRAGAADLAGDRFRIVAAPEVAEDGVIVVTVATLANLNAASLLVGGVRTEEADGTTRLDVTAREIVLANDPATTLTAPEILLAVAGEGASIQLLDGSALVAAGLADPRTDDLSLGITGGALVRVASGAERLVARDGDTGPAAAIDIGLARVRGTSVALDATGDVRIASPATGSADLAATNLAVRAGAIAFTDDPDAAGLVVDAGLRGAFAAATRLTLASPTAIGFAVGPTPTPATYGFGALTLDTPGLAALGGDGAVRINAGALRLANAAAPLEVCLADCGLATLDLRAASLAFGDGALTTPGFGAGVAITATGGVLYEGAAALDVGAAPLAIATPAILDRATPRPLDEETPSPALALTTTGTLAITGGGAAPTAAGLPGARLTLTAASVAIADTRLRATAGTLDVRATGADATTGSAAITGAAVLETPGFARVFGDAADPYTLFAPGGALRVVSANGDVGLGAATRLSVGGGVGRGGDLTLLALGGTVTAAGALDGTAPGEGSTFTLVTQGDFALDGFLAGPAAGFSRGVAIRVGTGDLTIAAGRTLAATDVRLATDTGRVAVLGAIDASGITGGDIALFGGAGVDLGATARLTARASGYDAADSRQARGGDIVLGTDGTGAITVAAGAAIDVAAARPGDRLVADIRNGETFYRVAAGDEGGTVTLRAPVVRTADDSADTVAATFAGTVAGAREQVVEGFRRIDLATVADAGFSGVAVGEGVATLDLAEAGANFLSGIDSAQPTATTPVAGSIPDLVQSFDVSAANAGLGSFVTAPTFRARPGIELVFAGDVTLASNWNLAAATIDVAGATAAGLLAPRPGTPALVTVVPGREAELLAGYANFTYRVGGDILGEAGHLAIRAEGTLTIARSVSDGFFTFRDQTDPAFLQFVQGGGARTFRPLISTACATEGCAGAPAFDPLADVPEEAIRLGFGTTTTLVDAPAPLTASANAAAAPGGDPLGAAELFPLVGGVAPGSWSLALVGGAAGGPDPLATGGGAAGVTITGERSYGITVQPGTSSFATGLAIDVNPVPGPDSVDVARPIDFLQSFLARNADVDPATTTVLTLNAPNVRATAFLRARASEFFRGRADARLDGDPAAPLTVVTTIAAAGAFLALDTDPGDAVRTLGDAFAAEVIAGGARPPAAPRSTPFTAFTRTSVRTGTGDIALAAAGDIDLTGGEARLRFNPVAEAELQVGGAAIYTAGRRATLAARTVATAAVDPGPYAVTATIAAGPTQRAALGALPLDPLYLDGGGDIALRAGRDVLGRTDIAGAIRTRADLPRDFIGAPDQVYRLGTIGPVTDIRVNPALFQSGVATLGGGDVRVVAGRAVDDLTLVAATTVTTADVTVPDTPATTGLVTFGGGDVAVSAGGDLLGGRFDIGEGRLDARVGGTVAGAGRLDPGTGDGERDETLRVRVTDALARVEARGALTLRGVAALGVSQQDVEARTENANARGFYTPAAGLALLANGRVTTLNTGADVVRDDDPNAVGVDVAVYPGTLEAASLLGDLVLSTEPAQSDLVFLYPSPRGQLRLFAGATVRPATVAMDDGDPGLLPGYFSTFAFQQGSPVVDSGRPFAFPAITSDTTETQRRALHNAVPTHLGNPEPVRVASGGDITRLILNTPKQTRISAGRDLVDAILIGQNLSPSDTTRIAAGRDVTGTTRIAFATTNGGTGTLLPAVQGNSFIVGGPGAVFLDAGRDAGPFLNSAVVTSGRSNITGTVTQTFGGGVITVGNEYNPFLAPQGADVFVQFGVARGVDYAALREFYVNPANVGDLEDDLFVQSVDDFGRFVADRSQPIYAPVLVDWVRANAAPELAAAGFPTDASLTVEQAYTVFAALPELRQRPFLIQDIYFNELTQTSIPTSVSYLRYSRGYRAVNTLFPPEAGYTANDLLGGGGTGTNPVATGDIDLRLATLQTARGGDIAILGPGGRVLGGSTVRTSAQAARRSYLGNRLALGLGGELIGNAQPFAAPITSIPTGFEGVLTLRGGRVQGFVDTDFLLNQSRLFTQAGGDIALWSSNGDLNAGQGPRTSANFPPVVVRVSPNAVAEVDALGGVSGAGIAAFQPAPGVEAPSVFLIAPRGTVDAGDAGVRVAGNLFVAALAVANADNFAVGGSAFGIPAGPVVNVGANTAGAAASAAASQAAQSASNATSRRPIDPLSRITVDVLGYYGGSDPCEQEPRPATCPPR